MRTLSVIAVSLVLWSVLACAATAETSAERRAAELLRTARAKIATGRADERLFARGLLEDARRLAPDQPEIAHALARLYLEADMWFASRRLAEACARRDPADAEAHFLQGEIWRREWLVRGEDLFRDRAIASLARGLKLAPGDFTRARMLVPLLEEARERQSAFEIAELAARANPKDPESILLMAYAAHHAGAIEQAGELFRRVLPTLPAEKRRLYDDLSPLLNEYAAARYRELRAEERERFHVAYWRDSDPDPTTEDYEGQVEFWARVTHGRLLYGVNRLGVWDLRSQLYIRFGPPGRIDRSLVMGPGGGLITWAAWTYPELGMRVWIPALNPLAAYGSRFGNQRTLEVRAFPDSLNAHPELQGVHDGYAVFRRLPLDVEPIPMRTALARFGGTSGALLLAQAEVEADPAGQLSARWVLLDSTRQVRSRASSAVGASACEPGALRAASFATSVEPGRYRLAVRVDDEAGRGAVTTREVVVRALSNSLAVSDLAVVCGNPAVSIVPGTGVRLEPSTGLRPLTGDELLAYLEIYHLQPGDDGVREFEYVCTVRPVATGRRSWLRRLVDPHALVEPIVVTRLERTDSDTRRQFFTVPVRSLPPGPYRMEVSVTDLRSGASTAALAEFIRR